MAPPTDDATSVRWQLPQGTALHVAPKQGKERHKTSDKLFRNYSGVVEPTWETKFINRLDWKLCNTHMKCC